jgi:hypothetical protein
MNGVPNWVQLKLIVDRFMSRLKIFHSYRDVTITSEGPQNLEQGGIFIVPHLLHGYLVFPVVSEGQFHLIAPCDTQN